MCRPKLYLGDDALFTHVVGLFSQNNPVGLQVMTYSPAVYLQIGQFNLKMTKKGFTLFFSDDTNKKEREKERKSVLCLKR